MIKFVCTQNIFTEFTYVSHDNVLIFISTSYFNDLFFSCASSAEAPPFWVPCGCLGARVSAPPPPSPHNHATLHQPHISLSPRDGHVPPAQQHRHSGSSVGVQGRGFQPQGGSRLSPRTHRLHVSQTQGSRELPTTGVCVLQGGVFRWISIIYFIPQ